ncbi:hypothetical protein ACC685_36235, partial [Rhizobium ruizarguesonis]
DLQTFSCCLPMIVCSLLALDFYLGLLSIFLIPFWLTTRAMANGVRKFRKGIMHDEDGVAAGDTKQGGGAGRTGNQDPLPTLDSGVRQALLVDAVE